MATVPVLMSRIRGISLGRSGAVSSVLRWENHTSGPLSIVMEMLIEVNTGNIEIGDREEGRSHRMCDSASSIVMELLMPQQWGDIAPGPGGCTVNLGIR